MAHQEEQPDPSATTQQFHAFVRRRNEAEAAAKASNAGKIGLLIGGVVVVLLLAAVISYLY